MLRNHRARRALALGGAALIAMSLTVSPAAQANTPKAGAVCTKAGQTFGTGQTALKCQRNKKTKALTWVRSFVPVKALSAPDGSIEFHHWRAEDKAVFDSIIGKFQAANPGTTVTQVIVTSAQHEATIFAQLRRNPEAALFGTLRGANFLQVAPSGIMADLTNERFLRNVNPNGLLAGQWEGRQVGVPVQYLFNNPVYNTEIFKKEKIKLPTKFSEVLTMCRTLKSRGYTPLAWPGAFRPQAGQILNSAMMNQFGNYGEILRAVNQLETGVKDLTVPWFKDMATKYAQMRDAGCFPDNPTGVTEPSANNLFATEKAAILPTGSFSMGAIKAINPQMEGRMALMSLYFTDSKPVYDGIHNNTFILSVNDNASSTDQQIAKAFISFMLQPNIASEYANGTTQHVNVLGVKYNNVDLINTGTFQQKKTLLAPRFLFKNLTLRNHMEDALIAIVGGKNVDEALKEYSDLIAQAIG